MASLTIRAVAPESSRMYPASPAVRYRLIGVTCSPERIPAQMTSK
jgi:hypothetical protein